MQRQLQFKRSGRWIFVSWIFQSSSEFHSIVSVAALRECEDWKNVSVILDSILKSFRSVLQNSVYVSAGQKIQMLRAIAEFVLLELIQPDKNVV